MAAPARPLALLLACALALGACGQTSKDSAKGFKGDQQAVAQTIENLQTEGSKRTSDSSRKICNDLLAPDLVARIKQASSKPCDVVIKDALGDADSFELQVQKVTINGDQATAVVQSQASGNKDRTDTLTLKKVGNAWKIAALGGSGATASG
jgi:hypothetical protein